MGREVWYATREQVKAAVDVKNSVRANAQIDRAIADASRSADRLCRRIFYPRLATRAWDWPDEDRPTPWRLWLGGRSEIISLIGFTVGGTALDLTHVLLYPSGGPPYTHLELDRTSPVTSFGGASAVQQNLAATAWYGYSDGQEPADAIVTAGGINPAATVLDVSDGSLVEIGHLLTCGTERMIVTGRQAVTTGLTVAGTGLTDKMNSVTLTLSSTPGAPNPGEMILIDGERMLVADRIGTTAYVQRAVDGTVLAAHTVGATVYAYRSLTIERGAVGTTAATHAQGTVLTRWRPPEGVNGYTVAAALNQIAQENSAYARVIGSGEGQREARGAGLAAKRDQLRTEYGRRVRMGAI